MPEATWGNFTIAAACNNIKAPTPEPSTSGRNREETNGEFISVVIPTYQSHHSLPLLTESLEAVLSSSGHEFEIIVVDDGSPDKTWETLRTLKRNHPRL